MSTRLAKPLEDIGTRPQALPEKGKIARILDKAQDTGEVVKLIERLRRTIFVYQVSPQPHPARQIDRSIPYMRAKTLNRSNHTRMDSIFFSTGGFCENALFRVEENATKNTDEFRRQRTLFEALEGIEDELRLLSRRSGHLEKSLQLGDAMRN